MSGSEKIYPYRTTLLQDLTTSSSCHRLKLSRDGSFLVALGSHPPLIRSFELAELSMKFERHIDAHAIDFQILTHNPSKMAILCTNRIVVIQARYGTHAKIRFPQQGRDIAYLPFTAQLVVVGSAPKIYRMDLQAGRFITPLPSRSTAINVCGYTPKHGLFSCAGADGFIECFDMRIPNSLSYMDVATSIGAPGEQLTALRYDDSGTYLAIGTSKGQIVIYDLLSPHPLIINGHMHKTAIIDIKFQESVYDDISALKVISSDAETSRIWRLGDGKLFTSIKAIKKNGRINDVCVIPGSGLVMLALENSNILPYFVPLLGPAPGWCSSLEGIAHAPLTSQGPK